MTCDPRTMARELLQTLLAETGAAEAVLTLDPDAGAPQVIRAGEPGRAAERSRLATEAECRRRADIAFSDAESPQTMIASVPMPFPEPGRRRAVPFVAVLSLAGDLADLRKGKGRRDLLDFVSRLLTPACVCMASLLDPETGLCGRAAFRATLRAMLARHGGAVVALVAPDGLRDPEHRISPGLIPANLGEWAAALASLSPATSLLGRPGFDVLAWACAPFDGDSAGIATALSTRLPKKWRGAACMGVAASPPGPADADDLLSRAHSALDAARSRGPGAIQIFDEETAPAGDPASSLEVLSGDPARDHLTMAILLKTARAMGNDADPSELLTELLTGAVQATGAGRGVLVLDQDGRLEPRIAVDDRGRPLSPQDAPPIPAGLKAFTTGDAVEECPGSAVSGADLPAKTTAVLAAPLVTGGKNLGAMVVDSPRGLGFSRSDSRVLSALASQAALMLDHARLTGRLREENRRLRDLSASSPLFEEIVGSSAPVLDVMEKIKEVAASDLAVLICGESGTGKDLAARAIHRASPRAGGPLVVQNCAAIPQELLESELFGYAAGAFTGAQRAKQGLIETAHGGTFLFDEIGDLDRVLQGKLLRVLEEGAVRRIGETRPKKVNFRALFATNRDLDDDVRSGRFRGDLFYRINVLRIDLPPLRERASDIPLLVEHFLQRVAAQKGTPVAAVSAEAQEALQAHAWPGNVRELFNVLERGVVHARGRTMLPEHLGMRRPDAAMPLAEAKAAMEREQILKCLDASDWNISRAARSLGVFRQQLQRLLRRHAIALPAPEKKGSRE